METTENTKKTASKKQISEQKKETVSAKDKIKPRGLSGILKGRIHYDKNADIFNLGF
jgi:hypothetical protein